MSGLYVLYQFNDDRGRWLPLGIGTAPSAERAVENLKVARAKAGVFQQAQFRAVAFDEAPFEDVVRASLDVLLNVIGGNLIATQRRGN